MAGESLFRPETITVKLGDLRLERDQSRKQLIVMLGRSVERATLVSGVLVKRLVAATDSDDSAQLAVAQEVAQEILAQLESVIEGAAIRSDIPIPEDAILRVLEASVVALPAIPVEIDRPPLSAVSAPGQLMGSLAGDLVSVLLDETEVAFPITDEDEQAEGPPLNDPQQMSDAELDAEIRRIREIVGQIEQELQRIGPTPSEAPTIPAQLIEDKYALWLRLLMFQRILWEFTEEQRARIRLYLEFLEALYKRELGLAIKDAVRRGQRFALIFSLIVLIPVLPGLIGAFGQSLVVIGSQGVRFFLPLLSRGARSMFSQLLQLGRSAIQGWSKWGPAHYQFRPDYLGKVLAEVISAWIMRHPYLLIILQRLASYLVEKAKFEPWTFEDYREMLRRFKQRRDSGELEPSEALDTLIDLLELLVSLSAPVPG